MPPVPSRWSRCSPPTISNPAQWSNRVGQQHGKIRAPTFTTAPTKSGGKRVVVNAKRKRADKPDADTVSSIPGVFVFDSREGLVQKKACSFQEDVVSSPMCLKTVQSLRDDTLCHRHMYGLYDDVMYAVCTPCDFIIQHNEAAEPLLYPPPVLDKPILQLALSPLLGSGDSDDGTNDTFFQRSSYADSDISIESPTASIAGDIPTDPAVLKMKDEILSQVLGSEGACKGLEACNNVLQRGEDGCSNTAEGQWVVLEVDGDEESADQEEEEWEGFDVMKGEDTKKKLS
ncbi:hypothetical protein GP486_003315 [Trichoglossum hirsutum]|uniref:Uncharacterized protein n=1 Tax=Trichoglossum hirsutum TaxID=265104 RepID=A0A9P8LD57_9PEZI|nr:hypothetical protein GP486_003315 [Trichoglossum hirsutum]